MSAYQPDKNGVVRCVECNSSNMNPKHSGESGVYWTRCEDCGFESNYIWPEEADD